MSTRSARPGDVALRRLQWTDIPDLAQVELELFAGDAWSAQSWWAELAARPRRDYVVAVADGQLAGYAGLDLVGETADVMTVAVAAAYQGQGLGTRLLEWVTHRARESGAEALLLEVRADNAQALALYRRHGFVELSRRPRYYQPGDVDALVLRRLLRKPSCGHQVVGG